MTIAADVVFVVLCSVTAVQITRLVYYRVIEPRIAPSLHHNACTSTRPDELTWTCMICGRRRPDALIGVASFTTTRADRPTVTANIRHCIDNKACADEAHEVAIVRAWTLAHHGESAHG